MNYYPTHPASEVTRSERFDVLVDAIEEAKEKLKLIIDETLKTRGTLSKIILSTQERYYIYE